MFLVPSPLGSSKHAHTLPPPYQPFLCIYSLWRVLIQLLTPELNEQQAWGGGPFQPAMTVNQPGPQGTGLPLPHAGFLASNSDDIFYPNLNTVPSTFLYSLLNVPFHRNYPAYMPSFPHIPVHREHLSQPPNRNLPNPTASSYNNPNFVVPPSSPPFIPHTV